MSLRYGIVGWGRIGARIAQRLAEHAQAPRLVAVLVRPTQVAAVSPMPEGVAVCDGVADFVASGIEVAVECASAEALAAVAPALLAGGVDLIPLSLAALADRAVEARFRAAAESGPGRVELCAGAMGSLDFLAAGAAGGLERVTFRARNGPATWRARARRALPELEGADAATPFLRGSVREVAREFPRSLNLSVGVALAGLGLDRTQAELFADPALTQAHFEVDAVAGPGRVQLRVQSAPRALGADPVDYTTFSVLRLLLRRQARIAV